MRIFLKEKGVDIDLVPTPLTKGAHKSPEHLARNPLDQVPVLELEDGSRSIPHFRRLTSISPTLKISSPPAATAARAYPSPLEVKTQRT